MKTFVIPDLHGRYELLEALYEVTGIPRAPEDRATYDIRTVQLGDLANCVSEDISRDVTTLERSRTLIDVRLVGNHEHPYFGGPRFGGFWRDPAVATALLRLNWQAALAVGDTLLTHAGVPIGFLPEMPVPELAELLNQAWREDPTHPWFRQIGRSRFGDADYGGVLWRDDIEDQLDWSFNQVYGHTVRREGPIHVEREGTWSLNLDCGGHHNVTRIAAAWLAEDGSLNALIEASI